MKKFARLFALLVVEVLSNGATATPLAEDTAFQQILPLYSVPPANNQVAADGIQTEQEHLFDRLQTGAYGKPEDFTTKARLAFKTDKRPMVAENRPFVLRIPTEGPLANGWRSERQMFSWQGESESHPPPLGMPLTVEHDQPFRFGDFDELWLDYTPVPGISLCMPQLEMDLTVQPFGPNTSKQQDIVARADAWSALNVLSVIDATKSNWKEKDYGYIAGRMLGLAPDEDWRYIQDQKNAVAQRRLHERLDDAETLDIMFSHGVSAERINLRVSRKDNHSAGELVEFAGLLKNSSLPDGRPGVRLNLREALEKRFAKEWAENAEEPGKHHFYLQEIVVFIPGEARTFAYSKPILNIAFLSVDRKLLGKKSGHSAPQNQTLASYVINVNSFRQRLVVDLHQLAKEGVADLREGLLRLEPAEGATSCAIRIEGVQAVSVYNSNIPTFARRLEDWSRRWGGLFSVVTPQFDQIENPGIIGFLPLATLTLPVLTQDQSLLYRIVGLNGEEIAQDTTRLISPIGVVLGAEGAMPRATVEGDLLVLEGQSKALEIAWPLATRVNDKTWFYFGVGEGVEQIGGITLTLSLADGSIIQRRIVPNQPLRLVAGEAEVRNVRLRILPAVTSYRFKLSEMIFFAPSAASYTQAVTIPLPTPYNVTPKLVLQSTRTQMLEMGPGRVAGLAAGLTAGEPLRFSTTLDPALDWVRGLRLNYRLPLTYADSESCPLLLQFNWANGKTERRVCFEKPDGALFIPMANWLGAADKPQNLGVLKSIDWVLLPATGGDRGVLESFHLQFAVEGFAMLSAADHVRLSSLFYAGHHAVFADAERTEEAAAGRYARKIWLPLEANTLSRMVAAEGQIRPAEHGLFTLDRVVAEPRQPMSWDRWRELIEPAEAYAPPRWPKWLAWASAVLLAWATWKKGWWSPNKIWALGKASVKVFIRMLAWMLGVATRWIWCWLPRLNLAIGLLALGPGLWLAGLYGLRFSGIMLLAGTGLVAWGAYCHWREQIGPTWPGRDAAMRVRFGALAVAVGCAIWSLGRYKLSTEAQWGFLPLLGAIYALLPALYRLGQQLMLRYRRYASLGGWLMLTMGLYGLGLLVKVSSGKNYFFTFGGLAAVFALRAGLLVIEPRFRRLLPAAAERVYSGAGSLYFSGALVLLIATAVMTSVKLEPIAEQLAIVVYFYLMIGAIKEAVALRRVASGRDV